MKTKKHKVVIFASGSGSNAENIINFSSSADNYCVAAVFCDKPNAFVLERAKRLNVPSYVFSPSQMRNNTICANGKETSFLKLLENIGADYLILAGFLLKVPDYIIEVYHNRILNIHPALLPAYGGKGMYGEHVHKAVIAAGEKESGITIHVVDNQYDHGNIVYQATCEVTNTDTPESLAAKIHELEKAYPEVIAGYIASQQRN